MTREQRIEAAARAILREHVADNGDPNAIWHGTLARAALEAAFPEIMSDPPTGWLAPMEATEAMEDIADAVAIDRADRGWAPNGGAKWMFIAMRDAHTKEQT